MLIQNWKYPASIIKQLNQDLKAHFPHLHGVENDFKTSFSEISRLVFLDRYSQKDLLHKTLKVGNLVITTIKHDEKFPTRGIGYVQKIDSNKDVLIKLEPQYISALAQYEYNEEGLITRASQFIDKPLELFWEQLAIRVGSAIAKAETTPAEQKFYQEAFANEIKSFNLIPAGRILYGAGSENVVTYYNCFVLPFMHDSRQGIARHREIVMEIMARGGGVGTNGSTLRPRGAVALKVGGKSSGAVSWLHDLSVLTHLVQQGGSRRGAQMIMMADWHPDIIEFIISKLQNPQTLLYIANEKNFSDKLISIESRRRLVWKPISADEATLFHYLDDLELTPENDAIKKFINENHLTNLINKRNDTGGQWEVINPEFLSGSNISITISDAFMHAVKHNLMWKLRFPDLEAMNEEQRQTYDTTWDKIGNIFEWEKLNQPIKTYYEIPAVELWKLINVCATYSAEPGVFFSDTASRLSNAVGYGQKIVATNPCGEQPLTPFAVCNLAAINLANFVDKKNRKILFDKLKQTVVNAIRFQDNVIDVTSNFLEENSKQTKGERRIGLGVMGLHDLLLWLHIRYGSPESLKLIDQIMQTICLTAYQTSIEIAKQKGSFTFLTDRKAFVENGFVKTLPEAIKKDILVHGIRNSHLLTIAPTGGTGVLVGVSTGIEPYYDFNYFRSGRLGKNMTVTAPILTEFLELNPEYKFKKPDFFIGTMELTPEEHVLVQTTAQKWVDASISKTVNAPRGYGVEQVQKIYSMLYEYGAKGGTVYVDGSRNAQVLSLSKEVELEQKPLSNLSAQINSMPTSILNFVDEVNPQSEVNYGVEIGNTCPICKNGIIQKTNGCNACVNCKAQLKCGL